MFNRIRFMSIDFHHISDYACFRLLRLYRISYGELRDISGFSDTKFPPSEIKQN